jgi:hypothetical protein
MRRLAVVDRRLDSAFKHSRAKIGPARGANDAEMIHASAIPGAENDGVARPSLVPVFDPRQFCSQEGRLKFVKS